MDDFQPVVESFGFVERLEEFARVLRILLAALFDFVFVRR